MGWPPPGTKHPAVPPAPPSGSQLGTGQGRIVSKTSFQHGAASGQRHPGDGARGGGGSVLSRGRGTNTQTPSACPRPTASPPALRTLSRARGAPQEQCEGVSPAEITPHGRLPLSWSRGADTSPGGWGCWDTSIPAPSALGHPASPHHPPPASFCWRALSGFRLSLSGASWGTTRRRGLPSPALCSLYHRAARLRAPTRPVPITPVGRALKPRGGFFGWITSTLKTRRGYPAQDEAGPQGCTQPPRALPRWQRRR